MAMCVKILTSALVCVSSASVGCSWVLGTMSGKVYGPGCQCGTNITCMSGILSDLGDKQLHHSVTYMTTHAPQREGMKSQVQVP